MTSVTDKTPTPVACRASERHYAAAWKQCGDMRARGLRAIAFLPRGVLCRYAAGFPGATIIYTAMWHARAPASPAAPQPTNPGGWPWGPRRRHMPGVLTRARHKPKWPHSARRPTAAIGLCAKFVHCTHHQIAQLASGHLYTIAMAIGNGPGLLWDLLAMTCTSSFKFTWACASPYCLQMESVSTRMRRGCRLMQGSTNRSTRSTETMTISN